MGTNFTKLSKQKPKISTPSAITSKQSESLLVNMIPIEILECMKSFLVDSRGVTNMESVEKLYEMELELLILFKLPIKNLLIRQQQHKLLSKYTRYNNDYDYHYKSCLKRNQKKCTSHPILIDILFSGCNLPSALSSYERFTSELEEDLKKCIQLFPDCVNSTFGQLRCRYYVTPLHAACFNDYIPINIIEYLVIHGADTNCPINVNGSKMCVLEDLESCTNYVSLSYDDGERIASIRKIFESHKSK